MGIKTTITPREDTATVGVHSLWKHPDGDEIYVLIACGRHYSTLSTAFMSACWISHQKTEEEAVKGLAPFHGTVTIELGGGK